MTHLTENTLAYMYTEAAQELYIADENARSIIPHSI